MTTLNKYADRQSELEAAFSDAFMKATDAILEENEYLGLSIAAKYAFAATVLSCVIARLDQVFNANGLFKEVFVRNLETHLEQVDVDSFCDKFITGNVIPIVKDEALRDLGIDV